MNVEIVARDPSHFTERALYASACYQVWCEAMFAVRQHAAQSVFHGDQPVGEVSRFQGELGALQFRETYARMRIQAAFDWLTEGEQLADHYNRHAAYIWGDELVGRVERWWNERFNHWHAQRVANHARGFDDASRLHEALKQTPAPTV